MHHLYFASCVPQGGIYHCVLRKGQLELVEKTACDRPMYLDVKEGSMQALLRAPFEENEESGLVEYPLDSDGSLGTASPPVSTKGVVACHLCRYQGKTYVANYISGSVFSTGGALRTHSGTGIHPTRQDGSHLHFVQGAPDGKCLFAVDLGTDSVYSYDENLQLLDTVQVPPGCGARHLAFSEDGKTVFCVNELASSVSIFAYSEGKLSLQKTVKALERENPGNTAAAIRVRGNYVYVSNRGEDSISCLEWDGKDLQLRCVTPCGGISPRDFILVEDYLFCTNEGSDNVTVFRVKGPALMKEDQELVIPSPLCAVELTLNL